MYPIGKNYRRPRFEDRTPTSYASYNMPFSLSEERLQGALLSKAHYDKTARRTRVVMNVIGLACLAAILIVLWRAA